MPEFSASVTGPDVAAKQRWKSVCQKIMTQRKTWILLVLFIAMPSSIFAQTDSGAVDPGTGVKPSESRHGSDIDSVTLTNHNLVVHIPLMSYPQRGEVKLDFNLIYNGKGFQPSNDCGQLGCRNKWLFQGNGVQVVDGQKLVMTKKKEFQPFGTGANFGTLYTVATSDGSSHILGGIQLATKNGILYYSQAKTIDGTGIAYFDPGPQDTITTVTGDIIDRDGVHTLDVIGPGVIPGLPPGDSPSTERIDANGNEILWSNSGWVDSIGRNIPGSHILRLSTLDTGLWKSDEFVPGVPTNDFSGCSGPLPIVAAVLARMPGVSGGVFAFKFCYANVQLLTNFPVTRHDIQYQAFIPMLQSVVLPNNTAWTFEYDDRDPGDAPDVNYGSLTKITFPTGGSLTYTWGTEAFPCQGSGTRSVLSRTLDDGTGPHTWSYVRSPLDANSNYTTTVSNPPDQSGLVNEEVHSISDLGSCNYYETQTQWFQGSQKNGKLLKTVQTDYQFILIKPDPYFHTNSTPASGGIAQGVLPVRKTTTWPGGKVAKEETDYDSFAFTWDFWVHGVGIPSIYNSTHGNPIAKRVFDYGQGTPGPLLRQETLTYQWQQSNRYLNSNLLDLPASMSVQDGAGNQAAQTTYQYDEPARLVTPNPPITTQHAAPPGPVRGNLTSLTKSASDIGNLTTHTNWYDTGMPYQEIDGRGHAINRLYDPAFAGGSVTRTDSEAPDPTGVNGSGLPLKALTNYDFNTGVATQYTDKNSNPTSYGYNDPMGRLASIVRPDGSSTTYTYGDVVGDLNLHTVSSLDSSHNMETYLYFDGAGHTIRTLQLDGTSSTPWVARDTYFDARGRVVAISNPYRVGVLSPVRVPCGPTVRCKTISYDALDRVLAITTADGATVTNEYTDNAVRATDQAGKTKDIIKDALGRVVQVTENPTNVNGEPSLVTTYGYNVFNELASVAQGVQHRFYMYDSLGRRIRDFAPEEGVNPNLSLTDPVTGNSQWSGASSYDENGNMVSRTDARGIITTATFDALNRVLTTTYSDGTPPLTYSYDGKGASGLNTLGRKTKIYSTSGSYTYDNYDVMGRVLKTIETVDNQDYPVIYQYDLAGNLSQETYPSQRTVETKFDAAGRPSSIGAPGRNPAPYANFIQYSPDGDITDLLLGNGYWEHTEYDPNRLQPTDIRVGTSQGAFDVLRLQYDYGTTNNNGNVLRQIITLPGTPSSGNLILTQLAQYDAFNRLKAAQEDTGNVTAWQPTAIWEQDFSLDSYGNRTGLSSTGLIPPPAPAPPIDPTTNRIDVNRASGYAYDPAGNLSMEPVAGGTNNYSYDANNHLIQNRNDTQISRYQYDGLGHRIKKISGGTTIVFVYDVLDHLVAEYTTATPTNNGTRYLTQDILGSERLVTGRDTAKNPQVVARYDYLPFGQLIPQGLGPRNPAQGYGAMGISNQLFTGKERDNETGLDYFGARYLSATNGRFTSPDPHGGRVGHPQTMNRYSYVVNNPLVFVDPSGLECLYLNSKNEVQLVTDVSRENCGKTGGYYIKGVATDIKVEIVNGHREVLLSGTTNGHDSTFAFYQDTTLNIGWYQNSHTNPLGHIAVAVGNRTPVGLSTKQEGKFVLSVLWDSLTKPHRGAVDLDDTVVPGAIVEQNPKNLKEMVSIPITGMQAVLIQNFIDEQKNSPPPYSTGTNHGPACDCSTWAQEVMKAGGLKSGQTAPVPENLIRQLEHLYGPSHK